MIAVVRTTLVGLQPEPTACARGVCANAAVPTSATSAAASFVTCSVSVGDHRNLKSADAVVPSFNRTGNSVAVQTIDIDTSGMDLFDANPAATDAGAGILDANRTAAGAVDNTATTWSIANLDISTLTDSAADVTKLNSYISGADSAVKEMTDAASSLGAIKSRIGLQQDFVKGLMDALDRGVGTLVDADMNQESTKLQALQVQQQLGVQALSIANSSTQSILKLFQ